jgi:VWFA-related protein
MSRFVWRGIAGRAAKTLVSAAAIATLTVPAADATPPTRPTSAHYRSVVDAVVLDVYVRAPDGTAAGLTAEDFLVTDEGVPQRIVYFEAQGAVPIAALLLIDRSQSMTGARLELAKAAAMAFADTLRPVDYLSIVAFNQTTERMVPFTNDREAARGAISGMTALGLTGLHEAIAVGLDDLAKFARQRTELVRQVLVVLSDGEDTTRRLCFEDIQSRARQGDAMIYVVSSRTDAQERPLPLGHAMTALAIDTGGRTLVPARTETLAESFEDIGHELQQLYRIGFEPKPAPGGWRRLSVHVSKPGAHARTRSGYTARGPARGTW